MDLHLHTPASADYRESTASYLDILKKAEQKGLDIIAISDHNTAAGYRRYVDELEDLELLERRNRLNDQEKEQLAEFRRLREKILVLPGFELTATLGFHVLGIFPPETTVREIEHLLLDLHVPAEKLDVGSGEVGATTDVLTAYRLINEAGGLAIAAHANSSHGVAMPGFDFGGQTRIAYTQDGNLHALEVTDLASKSRRRTQLFFSGTKPEYPRKMHCIQGSDAHRVNGISGNNQELGVGDRPTEILIPEVSFDAIMDVLTGKDFSKTRPYVPTATHEFDPIFAAREEGDTLVQAFHDNAGKHGIDRHVLQDVVALANTNGGTIYIGASPNIRLPVSGVPKPFETITQLRGEINRHIVPPLEVQMDTIKSGGKQILQLIVPRGTEVPYALDSTQIFVRSESETSLAVRDEIVNLVKDALAIEFSARVENAPLKTVQAVEQAQELMQRQEESETQPASATSSAEPGKLPSPPPHTGVEIVASKARPRGNNQYTMRDLRNNRIIHNVTRSSARKLWQYAIAEHDKNAVHSLDVKWLGDIGIVKASERAGKLRYDLAQRDSNGDVYVYYGVTDDGIHGAWKDLIESLSGQTTVEQLADEDENGVAVVVPEEFEEPTESAPIDMTEAHDAAVMFEADDAAIPAAEQETEGTLGMEPPAMPYELPKLMTSPGRNHFPPVVSDLSPSTPETDDVPASAGLGVIPHMTESAGAMPAAEGAVEVSETPVMTTQETAAESAETPVMMAHAASAESDSAFQMGGAEAPALGELGVTETEAVPVMSADENAQAPMMATEALPASGALGVMDPGSTPSEWAHEHIGTPVMPDPLQVVSAPTEVSAMVPEKVESGGEYAPIVPPPPAGTHIANPEISPSVHLDYDDQIVLPPSFLK